QAQLDRGIRMVEILKQPQFQPMHVIDQVTSIFAAASGHIDKVPVSRVAEYETKLLTYVKENHAPFRDALLESMKLDDDAEAELNRICAQFTEA
ncbi:MAG: F0F1 ATP synthase subunit alpha, partial [Planctomycetota bacterium]|nr:F0F1 ATP synthase subunit alpha [Planctomycetota bacterium]